MVGFDFVALVVLLGFAFLGSSRGLIDQILRIIPTWGTVLFLVLTQSFWSRSLDPWISPSYRSSLAVLLAAISAYPLLLLLVRFLSWKLASTPLGIFNRIGGGLLGLMQGALYVLLMGFALWLTPIAHEKIFYQSFIAQAIYPLVQKASAQSLWIALKTQPASLWSRMKMKIFS